MNTDPTVSEVVFLLARGAGEQVTVYVDPRDDHGIRQLWDAVRGKRGVRADEVDAISTQWQPSPADCQFIATMFPRAEFFGGMPRPGPDGWEAAFEAARYALDQMAREHAKEEAAEQAGEEPELLPVLWSVSSPVAELRAAWPHRPFVPGRLSVGFAVVSFTPHGTIGMNHVTQHTLQEFGSPSLDDLWEAASDELARGLKIEGESTPDGDLLTMHRPGSVAAAAVALPDFHRHLSAAVSDDRLVVGLTCQDHLFVTGAGSGRVDDLKELVASSHRPSAELVPAVLWMDSSGVQVIAECADTAE